MKINEILLEFATSGSSDTSGGATYIKTGAGSPEVGTLFGGSYERKSPFTKKAKK